MSESRKSSTGKAAKSERVRAVIERYYQVVEDLNSVPADLADLLADRVTIHEHPNPISPQGSTRGRADTLAGFLAGKDLLSHQAFDLHEILVAGDRAAVRATWRGTIGVDAGPLAAGTELTAHVAAFVTVRHGRIVAHETFDCYEPFTEPERSRHPSAH